MTWVAGVDGCRGGWLAVLRPLDRPGVLHVRLLRSFVDVLALPERPAMFAIDIPIGLPERSGPGGRAADIAARANLGARQSAVFAVPSRRAVFAPDYATACAEALATSEPPRKVSKQTFHLFPKIREVDGLLTPAVAERVREVHPEVAFWALNGCRPLAEPKKVKSRPYPPGLELRRELLAGAGYPLAEFDRFVLRTSDGGADDVLDAAACSWSAARLVRGEALRFPVVPEQDARGLPMEIAG